MAPISEVACALVDQMHLKDVWNRHQVFLLTWLAGRDRTAHHSCYVAGRARGRDSYVEEVRSSQPKDAPVQHRERPQVQAALSESSEEQRALLVIWHRCPRGRRGFFNIKYPQPSDAGGPLRLNLSCSIMETFKVEWDT